jgi:uncharacterized protein (TIGR00251 family)
VTFFRRDQDGLVLTVRAAPKASRDAVVGPMPTPDGAALKVAVTAPADKGKANAAVIAVLAKAFGVAKRDVALISGEADRRKVLRVAGNPATLAAIAQTWMEK